MQAHNALSGPETELTDPELLREIYVTLDEIAALFDEAPEVCSLHDERPGTGLTWEDTLPGPAGEAAFQQFELREHVAALLQDLPADQRQLLKRLYWEEQDCVDAADAMGLSTLEFDQLHGEALTRMRYLWGSD